MRQPGHLRFVALLAVVCTLTAGLGSQQSRVSSASVFKLGIEAPLTGPDADSGAQIKDAATMAFDGVHDQVGPYHIQLVYIDDKSDPAAATAAYEQAIVGQGIQAGFGNWNTAVSMATMDVAARHKIPHFFSGGTAAVIDQKERSNPAKYDYWMGKQYPPAGQLQALYGDALNYFAKVDAKALPYGKTVAFFGEDTDYGRGMVAALSAKLKKYGWNVKDVEYFAIDDTSHYSMLQKFANLHVSVVAGTGTALEAMASLIKQAKEIGLKSLIIADGLGYTGNWYNLTGAASDGVLDMEPEFATPAAKAFEAAFRAKYGVEPSPESGAVTYDFANFLIQIMHRAIQEYGQLSSSTLYKVGKNELMTGKLVYTHGIMMKAYRFTRQSWPSPALGSRYFFVPVIQYFGGKPVIVYPPNLKQATVKWPS